MQLKGNGMSVVRVKLPPDNSITWWIFDTIAHLPTNRSPVIRFRAEFEACGGRWSAKRRAWYTQSPSLPTAIRALVQMPPHQISTAKTLYEQVAGGRQLSWRVVSELRGQGLVHPIYEAGYITVVEVCGVTFARDGVGIYREVRWSRGMPPPSGTLPPTSRPDALRPGLRPAPAAVNPMPRQGGTHHVERV